MINWIVVIIYIFFIILGTYYLYRKIILNKRISLIDWFRISLILFNGILFLFVYILTLRGLNPYTSFSQVIFEYNTSSLLIFLFFNVTVFLVSSFGWSVIAYKNKRKHTFSNKSIKLTAWFLLFISFIAYLLYTAPYGGFIGYLNYSRAIRSGIIDINNNFSFLIIFGTLAQFSSYLFYYFLIKFSKNNFFSKLGLLLSFSFSIYVLLSRVGRVGFLIYFLIFILIYVQNYSYSTKKLINRIILIFIFSFFILYLSDSMLGRSLENLSIVQIFVKEFSFPFVNFQTHIFNLNYRYFYDLIVSPIFYLPGRIWSGFLSIETASSYNTFLITGFRKGENLLYGEMPVDFITFGYLQFGYLGIVTVSFLMGSFLKVIHNMINSISEEKFRLIIHTYLVVEISILTIYYADPQHLINRTFDLVFGLLLLSFFQKIIHRRTF